MTNKIIIDGIDVSECCYYNSNEVYPCELYDNHCEDQYCYYQQLKRKEQECEELEAENKKLKDDLQSIQHNCTREGCRYYEDNTYKVFYNCKAKIELSYYKQALDEIEEYCNKDIHTFQDGTRMRYTVCDNILTIINKAKEK